MFQNHLLKGVEGAFEKEHEKWFANSIYCYTVCFKSLSLILSPNWLLECLFGVSNTSLCSMRKVWYRLCSIHAKPQWFRRFGYVDELISKDLAKNKDTIDDGLGELLVKFYTKRRKKHRNSNTRFASALSNCYAEKVSLFEVCLFKQKVTSFTLFKP